MRKTFKRILPTHVCRQFHYFLNNTGQHKLHFTLNQYKVKAKAIMMIGSRRYLHCYTAGFCAFVLLTGCVQPLVMGDEGDQIANRESLSILDGFAANWAGLDRCDVFMKVERFQLLPSGVGRDDSALYRFKCDFRSHKYLFVKLVEREETRLEDGNVARRGYASAFFFDAESNEAWTRDLPNPARRLPVNSPNESLAISRFPDIRLIGCYGLTRDFDTRFDIDKTFQAEFHIGKSIREVRKSDNITEIAVDDPYQGGRLRRRYKFDLDRLVPISMSYGYGTDENEVLRRREEYVWTQRSHLYVPTEVHGEKLVSVAHKGKKRSVNEQFDATLHWFSVNQPLDDEVVNAKTLRDDERLYQLIKESTVDRPTKKK